LQSTAVEVLSAIWNKGRARLHEVRPDLPGRVHARTFLRYFLSKAVVV